MRLSEMLGLRRRDIDLEREPEIQFHFARTPPVTRVEAAIPSRLT
jgi:hypothetical protein